MQGHREGNPAGALFRGPKGIPKGALKGIPVLNVGPEILVGLERLKKTGGQDKVLCWITTFLSEALHTCYCLFAVCYC